MRAVFLAVAPDGRVLVNMAQGETIDERLAELSRLHKRPLDWPFQIPLRPTEAQGVIEAFHKQFETQRRDDGWFEVGVVEARNMLDELASRAINFRSEESRIHPADRWCRRFLGLPSLLTLTGGWHTEMRGSSTE